MDVVVGVARPEDDAGIRDLVRRQIMPGRIRLSMARDPDFALGCAVTGDDARILVARSATDGTIVGVACRSTRRVFLNGREERIGYLGQLRIDERFRGRWLLARGFSRLASIHCDDPVPVYLASIVDGNDEATGVLVRNRRPSFPAFRHVARYTTLALPVWWRRASLHGREEIAPATIDQIPELVNFLRREGARRHFSCAWRERTLHAVNDLGLRLEDVRIARRAGAIVGVIALWDQTAYKQTIVRGYSGWVRLAAALASSGAHWLPRTLVPGIGDEVRSAYASLICVENDDAQVFGRLLRQAYILANLRGHDYLLVGLDVRDPLLKVARAYPHLAYPSRLYVATWPSQSCAESSHASLDERPAYVDVATL
jgi:hypothetical protein